MFFFKCNFICSQVMWKKAFIEISSAVDLSSISLWGSSVSFSLFPPVNAMPSNNGFTPHVLRDGGCFHFYPHLKRKKKWKELRNWHFKNWWVRLRMACDEEWRDEWANGDARETDWLCDARAQILTAFWVCEWKLHKLPNMDILLISTSRFFFFLPPPHLSFPPSPPPPLYC